jgi:flavodoxin
MNLIVYTSSHHGNTEKIARAMGKILDAPLVHPDEVSTELSEYNLIGVGSGIYFANMDRELLTFIKRLPPMNKNVFIFSTRGMGPPRFYHRSVRKRLQEKGCTVVGEFSCKGWDTGGSLKYIGGINKGRPNKEDVENAKEFSRRIKENTEGEALP